MNLSDRFQQGDENNSLNNKLDSVCYISLFGTRIPVGKDKDNYYLLHEKTGEIICEAEQISDFIHKNRVIWVKTSNNGNHKMMINKRGKFLIDIRTAKHIKSSQPKEIESDTFKTKHKEIKWDGYKFEEIIKNKSSEESDDANIDKIESFLEEVNLSFGGSTDRIDDVKSSVPLVEIFDKLGEGSIDDGEFIPPSQDEYASYGYIILKNNADKNSEMFSEEYRSDWKSRLKRSWTSFVRDAHFANKISKQSDEFDVVDNSIEGDLNGADSVIVNDSQEYHINLYVDSDKSNKYLEKKKKTRHSKNSIVDESRGQPIDILVPIEVSDNGSNDVIKSRNNRDIYLYSDKHINAIKKLIENDIKKVTDENGNILCEVY